VELTRPQPTSAPRYAIRTFFGVVVRGQTYRNLIYLLLAFPLGLFYFTFLIIGFSLSAGLIFALIGIPLLIGMLVAVNLLARAERWLTVQLLRIDIPAPAPGQSESPDENGIWERLTAILADRRTWKGLVYLSVKIVTGLVWFVLIVTLLSFAVALLLAPLYYNAPGGSITLPWAAITADVWIAELTGAIYGSFVSVTIDTSIRVVDTLGEALLTSVAGLVVFFCSLHIFNGAARIAGGFARVMLRAGNGGNQ